TAAMLCTREVLNRSMMERRSGVIINFSSGAGWSGMPRKSHYSVAKGGLRLRTKVVATECGPYGIRCNCLVPGAIETELWRNYVHRTAAEEGITFEEKKAQMMAPLPLKINSTAEDIANFALYLASD